MLNLDNLKRLRDYLQLNYLSVQSHLNMQHRARDLDGVIGSVAAMKSRLFRPDYQHCSADLIGHAACSGVPGLTPAPGQVSWTSYIEQTFFVLPPRKAWDDDLEYQITCLDEFLFGNGWPNDLDHALARIDYVLAHEQTPDSWETRTNGYYWHVTEDVA